MARILGKYPNQHDRVILCAPGNLARVGQVFANPHDGFFGCICARLGGINDCGEMNVVIGLVGLMSAWRFSDFVIGRRSSYSTGGSVAIAA